MQLRVDKVGDAVRPVLGKSEQRTQQAGAEGDPDDKAERVGLWHLYERSGLREDRSHVAQTERSCYAYI